MHRLLLAFPPETAHRLAFRILRSLGAIGLWRERPPLVAPRSLWGLTFPHPIGLAAGLDKNAELLDFWAHLGFAFVEVGTVTPRPQPGNPRPRLFRIPQDQALLNRMGFNNAGAVAIARRLEKRPPGLIVGINLGKNKDTPLPLAYKDYATAYHRLRDHGDFFVLNVSSPNTPGLRLLQEREWLKGILRAVLDVSGGQRPILIKVSPDLAPEALEEAAYLAKEEGASGIVATNTTTQIKYPHLGEGGVSGKPLKPLRRVALQRLKPLGLPIIATGGFLSKADILEGLEDGAALVELYTGLVYKGPHLLRETLTALQQSTP
ncbi:MAG: quinone-dependent dihydroorotate dehydrogenase [Bacteroidia bacterium]|nr:quinone-dependent dihydroorotate dehydrogenase [Bacteroidia bacterium]